MSFGKWLVGRYNGGLRSQSIPSAGTCHAGKESRCAWKDRSSSFCLRISERQRPCIRCSYYLQALLYTRYFRRRLCCCWPFAATLHPSCCFLRCGPAMITNELRREPLLSMTDAANHERRVFMPHALFVVLLSPDFQGEGSWFKPSQAVFAHHIQSILIYRAFSQS